jgi:hypothetical protein
MFLGISHKKPVHGHESFKGTNTICRSQQCKAYHKSINDFSIDDSEI